MNIRVELLKLQENASLFDRAEFAAKFMTIADEYHRLQLLQQTQCTTHRELLQQKLSREYVVRDMAIRSDAMIQQHRANAKIELLQQLIDACQPVA